MLHTALMVDAFLVRKWSSQGPTSTYQRLHLCQCSASHHRWQFSKSNLDESDARCKQINLKNISVQCVANLLMLHQMADQADGHGLPTMEHRNSRPPRYAGHG